mmetsp:Transcript_61489/g.108034  ORF Transcript_61489/g.108034 Transcript_61489/m.108034 type:complete len:283 (+) Transcript_61489:684-1532(+)
MQSIGVGHRVGDGAQIGLDAMRQGIHACGGREALGHADHELGVVHGHGGHEAPIHDGHLHVPLLVGDDAEAGHLGRGAGSCVHRNQWQHRLRALVNALVVPAVAAVGAEHADGLGTIVRRAAAEGDDQVATVGLGDLHAVVDLAARGVGLTAVVDTEGDSGLLEEAREGIDGADLNEDLVRDDQRLRETHALDLADRTLQSTFAQQRLVGHEEDASLAAGGRVVVVDAMRALSRVPCKVHFDVGSHVLVGCSLVELLCLRLRHDARMRGVTGTEPGAPRPEF